MSLPYPCHHTRLVLRFFVRLLFGLASRQVGGHSAAPDARNGGQRNGRPHGAFTGQAAARSQKNIMETTRLVEKDPKPSPDDLIVIGGGGGFIGGALARHFQKKGFKRIRAADKKPLPEWYQRVPGVECLNLDLSVPANCEKACEGAVEVYNLAADMGGMGFIERFRVECLRSILINTHMRSEEHTSELQSLRHLVCRLLLEKKKKKQH